jgi:hypothetical protein
VLVAEVEVVVVLLGFDLVGIGAAWRGLCDL